MPYFSASHNSNQHSSLNKDGVSEQLGWTVQESDNPYAERLFYYVEKEQLIELIDLLELQ